MESENKQQILALSIVTYGTFITIQLGYGFFAGSYNNFDRRKISLSENLLVGKIVSENLPPEKLCRKICRRKNCVGKFAAGKIVVGKTS